MKSVSISDGAKNWVYGDWEYMNPKPRICGEYHICAGFNSAGSFKFIPVYNSISMEKTWEKCFNQLNQKVWWDRTDKAAADEEYVFNSIFN